MSDIRLRGMTWSHPRGYDPLVACAALWRERTGVTVEWDKRSLQDFESFPVEELARQYDLIVIDHPHVGQVTDEGCLLALDVPGREAEREAMAAASVGRSYPSYTWRGRQWAFPIDAATQVQAIRPDLIETPPRRWDEVVALARQGRVLLPLRVPHSLMCFFSLCANLGTPCATEPGAALIAGPEGARALDLLAEIAGLVDPGCFEMDPIAASEEMATGGDIACVPLMYGYVSYALDGFRPHRLRFADIPAAAGNGPAGTVLGGTGIAVSARSAAPEAAIDFAYWVAGAEVQRGPYAAAGGQPGHGAAWDDDAVNAAAGGFYRGTRATLEGAWVRPRFSGYMAFQDEASGIINDGLRARAASAEVIDRLNAAYAAASKGAG